MLYEEITTAVERGKRLLFVVVDPLDHEPGHISKVARAAEDGGAFAIVLGGSTGVQGEILESAIDEVREETSLPIILFPGNIGTVSPRADAIYFMSLMNSRNPYWITRVQVLAAPLLKAWGVETISTAYVVVEPGGTVGWVGEADLIPRAKPKIAAAFAMAAEMAGFELFITDAGSAAPQPIPPEFVKKVSSTISIPYVVAGGIRTPEQAKALVKAGADILQIGTAFEKDPDPAGRIKAFVKAMNDRH